MPRDKDFKRMIRARMADSGERYTQARPALERSPAPSAGWRAEPAVPGSWAWEEALGEPDSALGAYQHLKTLPADRLVALAVAGTAHVDWRARRSCCRLLDALAFTDESVAALQRCAADTDPRVRRAAVHTLVCQHCKPEGCAIDVRPWFEAALRDSSRRLREMVVGPLTYRDQEPWQVELLRQVARADPSPTLRDAATRALEARQARLDSDMDRRSLEPSLVAKSERHAGKWVAISQGRIIDVGGHPDAIRRGARKHGHDDVHVYWVRPGQRTNAYGP